MKDIMTTNCDSTAKTESSDTPEFGTFVRITSSAALFEPFEGEKTEERQHAEEFLALCVSQESSQGSSEGVNSPTCSSTHLYDGVDDVLNIQDEEDGLALGDLGSEANLYNSVVMGDASFEEGSQTEEGQLSQEEFSPNGKLEQVTSTVVSLISNSNTAGYSNKRIPDAYTDDLADDGSPSRLTKKYSDPGSASISIRPRRHAVYIGNLTWWTTDEDISSALHSVGVLDIVDIKFIDCRVNGQSKGFCLVTFKTETSVAAAFEKVAGVKIHERIPLVKPDTKQSLILLDSQAKTRPVPNSSMSMGSSVGGSAMMCGGNGSRSGLMHNMGSNYGAPIPNRTGGPSGIRHGYSRGYGYRMGQGYRGTAGPMNVNGSGGFYGYSSNGKPQRPMGMSIRGPPPPVVMNNSYGSAQYDEWYRPSPYSMVRSGPGVVLPPFPHLNPAFRGPRFIPPSYGPSNDGLYHGFYETDQAYLETSGSLPNIGQEESVIPAGLQGSPVAVTPPFLQQMETHSSPVMAVKTEYVFNETDVESDLNEDEIDEMLSRNNTVSTAAIKRAVKDASAGEYASAIETLVTAISLLKSSKIARDKRCVVLISSLQDTLEGIEHRSYGRKDTSDNERKGRMHRSRNRDRSPSHRRTSISIEDRHRESRSFAEDSRSGRTSRRTWEERDRSYLDSGEKAREYEHDRTKVRRIDIERDDRTDSYRRNH